MSLTLGVIFLLGSTVTKTDSDLNNYYSFEYKQDFHYLFNISVVIHFYVHILFHIPFHVVRVIFVIYPHSYSNSLYHLLTQHLTITFAI